MAFGAAARLKILFPYLARVRAANWSRYQQLLAARARKGDDVVVLEPPPRRSAETNFHDSAIELPDRFDVREVALPSWFWNCRLPFDKIVKKGSYSLAANRQARRIARREGSDVALIYNLTQRQLLSLPIPVIFDMADDLPAMLRVEAGVFGPLAQAAARRSLRAIIGRAAAITTPCRTLLPVLGPRAVFIPNGVDPAEITEARAAAAGSHGEKFRIGFLGSFEYFIDFDLILELAARLPDAEFLLIGGGRRFEEIRSRTRHSSNVTLAGPLAHPRALARLATCDLSLSLFLRGDVGHHASPLKLFESLALGVPVLASRTREILAENPPNTFFGDTAEEAAAAVASFRARPEERRRQDNERGAAETLSSRSWERIGENWADLAKDLVTRT